MSGTSRPAPLASASSAVVPYAFSDRSAVRRISAPQQPGAEANPIARAAKPLHLSWFAAHFKHVHGHGHFSQLAVFRWAYPHPPLSLSANRSLLRVIELGAWMRIAVVRPAEFCDFCSHPAVAAPFCAHPPPGIQPAGTRQHANSRSKRCLLQRTLNGLAATPERIQLLFADDQRRLRVIRDTDDRGRPMRMLELYRSAIWNAAHAMGLAALLVDLHVVLHAHGLGHAKSPERDHVEDLCDEFAALADSLSTPSETDEVEALARLHVGIFGADYADYAMYAILVALSSKLALDAAAGAPQRWLVDVAVRVHAEYEPDEYIAPDGSLVRVRRDHSLAQQLFAEWMRRTFPNAPGGGPAVAEMVPARRSRSDQDEEDLGPRPPRKRARRQRAAVESDDEMDVDTDELGWTGDAMQTPPRAPRTDEANEADDASLDTNAAFPPAAEAMDEITVDLLPPHEQAVDAVDVVMADTVPADTVPLLARQRRPAADAAPSAATSSTATLQLADLRRRRTRRRSRLMALASVAVAMAVALAVAVAVGLAVGFALGINVTRTREYLLASMADVGDRFIHTDRRPM